MYCSLVLLCLPLLLHPLLLEQLHHPAAASAQLLAEMRLRLLLRLLCVASWQLVHPQQHLLLQASHRLQGALSQLTQYHRHCLAGHESQGRWRQAVLCPQAGRLLPAALARPSLQPLPSEHRLHIFPCSSVTTDAEAFRKSLQCMLCSCTTLFTRCSEIQSTKYSIRQQLKYKTRLPSTGQS
jgi:hypothetical protein